MCCSSGCGHTCQTGDSIPYYEISSQCPISNSDGVDTCAISDALCSSNSDCSNGELCCRRDGCKVCTTPERTSTPCLSLLTTDTNVLELVGQYTPQCLDDGTFAPVQCHGSTGYCWCVNTLTGVPISSSAERGRTPCCISKCHFVNESG